MADLADGKCIPCRGGVPPLQGFERDELLLRLGNGWQVVDGHHLSKNFTFANFRQALDFANRIGGLAEAENHHPDLHLAWGKVGVEIWTHKIDGLTESDFVFAAKTELLK